MTTACDKEEPQVHTSTVRYAIALLAASAAVLAAGCSTSGGGSPAVPSLSQSAAGGAAAQGGGGSDPSRASALHAAAQCIRQHGIPRYSDPVLTPGGAVYTDARSFQNAGQQVVTAIYQACRTLMTEANLQPLSEPPAPVQLVQAGVTAAECLRANGLPNITDPTTQSSYVPGHGFQMNRNEMPAAGKASPVWQHARQACNAQVDAEITASTLGSLSNDG
jgi:hypothetical protein